MLRKGPCNNASEEDLVICRDLLAHLIREPARQDTFEGLATWWILDGMIKRKTETLRRATQWLVDVGYLESERRLDGRVHYRLAASRLAEIRAFVAASGEEEVP